MKRSPTSAALLGLATLVAVACHPPPRPSMREWQNRWSAARGLVPDATGFAGAQARDVCDHLLASVREARVGLLPAPVATLDPAVEQWVHAAEHVGLECPIAKGDQKSFAAAMQQLEVLEAEIDAGLAAQERENASSG